MASWDKSQGFAFVYTDLKKLMQIAKRKAAQGVLDDHGPVAKSGSDKVIKFNRDDVKKARVKQSNQPEQVVPSNSVRERAAAINEIKQNLDRLQSLHHKLHTVLADINTIADKKKKK